MARAAEKMTRRQTRLDPFKLAIDAMLQVDLDAPRKQRHTVTRTFHRLMDDYGAADISYAMVRRCVQERRPRIRAAVGPGSPAPAGTPRAIDKATGHCRR